MTVEQNINAAVVSPQRTTTTTSIKRTFQKRKKSIRRKLIDTVLVVNPNSSSGITGKGWDDLYSEIKNVLGSNLEVALTKKPGDGSTLARQFLKQGFKKVVAIGGDGTLNEVANGFFEEPVGIHSNKINDGPPKFPPLRPINP